MGLFAGLAERRSGRGQMKGVSSIFERVLLFVMGVVIFIACFAIFINYQVYFEKSGIEDQLDMVGNTVGSAVLKLAARGNATESSLTVEIPPRIGNSTYFVKLTNLGIEVTMTSGGRTRSFQLYGLNESFSLGGERTLSSMGKLVVYKKGNRIIIV